MATKTVVQLVDDLTGEQIEDGDGETITFAFQGKSYKIDLSIPNADDFRKTMQKYIKSGEQTGTTGTTSRSSRTSTSHRNDKGYLQSVRNWAATKGIQVSSRGRIAQPVLDQYEAEH